MFGRRSIIGIAVLCALALSAFTAGNAAAAQRSFTCAPTGTGFSDAHCVTSTPGSGSFSHVSIENGVETAVTGTNEKTASSTTAAAVAKLKGALSGVETEISCTSVHIIGVEINTAAATHYFIIFIFTNCSVTKPAGKGCKVAGGEITTKELSATTEGQAANSIKVTPKSGTEFASIKIEGCSTEALNNTFPVTGSLTATASGATASTTHAGVTTQNTLKFGGTKAGLEGAATISMKEGNPIALT